MQETCGGFGRDHAVSIGLASVSRLGGPILSLTRIWIDFLIRMDHSLKESNDPKGSRHASAGAHHIDRHTERASSRIRPHLHHRPEGRA
ncbi:hypothetical protein MES4922_40148 [Mesorhizobium ventifaucium]|uniref:Uncharacterized protein n=1 Tax=Mesorhizobium ventifaucium TaxID=666020 RepID=A0ABM9E7Y0_9HYPH|nr:hypothetical protein MES4922_40148 [Mesorhizobium ventifaucium]